VSDSSDGIDSAAPRHRRSVALQIDGRTEFAHPVDAHYSCSSLLGWPQLLVTVWQTDALDRHEIGSYVAQYGSLRHRSSSGLAFDIAGGIRQGVCTQVSTHHPVPTSHLFAAGYGIARVPPAPGVHLLEVVCWRPEGSWLQELAGALDSAVCRMRANSRPASCPAGDWRARGNSGDSCAM